MSYYATIEDDLARAKAILAKGRTAEAASAGWPNSAATIYGADLYAAYKLLESFVEEIERLRTVIARNDIGFDTGGNAIAIGVDAREHERRIVEDPDAVPVLLVARVGSDLGVRVYGPPSLDLAEVLAELATSYRAAVTAARQKPRA
jgi:hypothetical protein